MKTLDIISAISSLGNLICECCHRKLIDDNEEFTVIKKHLLKTYKKKGVIEIVCRHCDHCNVIANNN